MDPTDERKPIMSKTYQAAAILLTQSQATIPVASLMFTYTLPEGVDTTDCWKLSDNDKSFEDVIEINGNIATFFIYYPKDAAATPKRYLAEKIASFKTSI
jgi:hypothetical protein